MLLPSSLLADSFTVGVVPQFDIKTLYRIWNPILDQLEQRTGHQFSLRGSPDIPAFEQSFANREFDFAYMNPYHYTIAGHYQPIAKDHGRKLYGLLVVKAESEITELSQLQGKTLAFPAPNALGASLMIRAELERKYGIQFEPKYVNTHSSVYLNVVLGLVPAGGGVQKTFNQQKPEVRDQLRVLLQTDPVEPHPFTARKDLDPALVAQVQQVLLEMGQNPEHQALLARVPFKQIGIAVDADYESIRQLNLDHYYVKPER